MRALVVCACVLMALGCGQKEEAGKTAGKPAPAPNKAAAETPPEAKPEPVKEPVLTEAQQIEAIAREIPELAGPYMTMLEVRKEESALHEQHKDDPKALNAALEAWKPSALARLKPACLEKMNASEPAGDSPEANKLGMVMLHLGSVTLELSGKDRAIRDQWDEETRRQIHGALGGMSCEELVDED